MAFVFWDYAGTGLALLVCLVVSVILLQGRGGWLIAGYNLMSPQEKARIDEKGLCRFMGKVMACITLSVALAIGAMYFSSTALLTTGLILLGVSVCVALVWANVRYMRRAQRK